MKTLLSNLKKKSGYIHVMGSDSHHYHTEVRGTSQVSGPHSSHLETRPLVLCCISQVADPSDFVASPVLTSHLSTGTLGLHINATVPGHISLPGTQTQILTLG